MTELVRTEFRTLRNGAQCFCIRLDAKRSNALEPEILGALLKAFDVLEASGARHAVLMGGRNFSTGGDVSRFFDAAVEGRAEIYADAVVPPLQECVIRMIEMPVVFAAAARGAITGGSAGFLFASDLVVLSPDAFVQPYYAGVGFAPDGGWTAVLPEHIGAHAAQAWLVGDVRLAAAELQQRGLANAIDPEPVERALALLASVDAGTALATKELIWDEHRRSALRHRLQAEADAFRALIGRQETRSRMARFLGKAEAASGV